MRLASAETHGRTGSRLRRPGGYFTVAPPADELSYVSMGRFIQIAHFGTERRQVYVENCHFAGIAGRFRRAARAKKGFQCGAILVHRELHRADKTEGVRRGFRIALTRGDSHLLELFSGLAISSSLIQGKALRVLGLPDTSAGFIRQPVQGNCFEFGRGWESGPASEITSKPKATNFAALKESTSRCFGLENQLDWFFL